MKFGAIFGVFCTHLQMVCNKCNRLFMGIFRISKFLFREILGYQDGGFGKNACALRAETESLSPWRIFCFSMCRKSVTFVAENPI